MTTMKKYECKICGDYGWDLVDGVCTVCLTAYEQVTKPGPTQPKCGYCGEPANLRYVVWVNGGMVEKNFCNYMCANYYQMGPEG